MKLTNHIVRVRALKTTSLNKFWENATSSFLKNIDLSEHNFEHFEQLRIKRRFAWSFAVVERWLSGGGTVMQRWWTVIERENIDGGRLIC